MNDLNIRPESINLQEDTGTKSLNIGFGKECSDRAPDAKATKATLNKWNNIKLKSSTRQKKPSKLKRPLAPEEKKISVNHMCEKRLISKRHTTLIQIKTNKNCTKKWGEYVNRYSPKRAHRCQQTEKVVRHHYSWSGKHKSNPHSAIT